MKYRNCFHKKILKNIIVFKIILEHENQAWINKWKCAAALFDHNNCNQNNSINPVSFKNTAEFRFVSDLNKSLATPTTHLLPTKKSCAADNISDENNRVGTYTLTETNTQPRAVWNSKYNNMGVTHADLDLISLLRSQKRFAQHIPEVFYLSLLV